jgi:RNA polymerase sigma factor CnrH
MKTDKIDGKAFEILIRQHHRRLLAYAVAISGNEHAARDIVQEALLAAHRGLETFDVTRDFGAWMRGIVRNKFREWARRQHRYTVLHDSVLASVDREYHRMEQAAESSEEIFVALRRCLKKLPELMRRAIDLFYMKRMSGEDVARELEAKEPAVRKRLQRAREQLAGCLTSALEISHG